MLASVPAAGQAVQIVSFLKLYPPVGITEGTPGVFYFATGASPSFAFSVTTQQGSKTALGKVNGFFQGPLVSGANNRFYSATQYGGNPANVVSVGLTPDLERIFPPQDWVPYLTQNLPDGTFVGIAYSISTGVAYVANMDLQGIVTPIYQFPANQSVGLNVLYASDGNYYGTASTQTGPAVLYKLTPAGVLTPLITLPVGTILARPLIQASDGNLYGAGTTGNGDYGIIYQVTLAGEYTVIYTFPKGPMGNVDTLLEGSDGKFYGIKGVYEVGRTELFSLTKDGAYSLLAGLGFAGTCGCWLRQGSDSILYGAAYSAIFSFDAGLPRPAPRVGEFRPASGAVGQKVLIWGGNLLSASVQFNGLPANDVFSSGPNYVWATVPGGATTGPITVTTPGGTVTTIGNFTVQ
jgi:hypothetical protein